MSKVAEQAIQTSARTDKAVTLANEPGAYSYLMRRAGGVIEYPRTGNTEFVGYVSVVLSSESIRRAWRVILEA